MFEGSRFNLRWFTPTNEVDLCGHATLAAAKVVFDCCGNENVSLQFETKSGPLTVDKAGEKIILNFPLSDLTDEVIDSYASM